MRSVPPSATAEAATFHTACLITGDSWKNDRETSLYAASGDQVARSAVSQVTLNPLVGGRLRSPSNGGGREVDTGHLPAGLRKPHCVSALAAGEVQSPVARLGRMRLAPCAERIVDPSAPDGSRAITRLPHRARVGVAHGIASNLGPCAASALTSRTRCLRPTVTVPEHFATTAGAESCTVSESSPTPSNVSPT